MEMHQVRYFLSVARALNFTRGLCHAETRLLDFGGRDSQLL